MADTSLKDMTQSGRGAVSVVTSASTLDRSRAVFVGESSNYDFTFDGTNWIKFQGCVAGSMIPIQVLGARYNASGAAPSAGSIVFIY